MSQSSSDQGSKPKSHKSKLSSSYISQDAEKSLLRAATRKAELQCRQEALKRRLAMEGEAMELKQAMDMLTITTKLEVEEMKLATLDPN